MPSKSEKQRRFFAMIHAANKSGKKLKGEAGEVQKEMSPENVRHYTKLGKNASMKKTALEELYDHIAKSEGFRSKWYNDRGQRAIGFGMRDTPENRKIFKKLNIDTTKPITEQDARSALKERIKIDIAGLKKFYKGNYDNFPIGVKRSLADLAFNSGPGSYPKYTDMNKSLSEGDYLGAASGLYDSKRSLIVHSNRARWGAEQMSGDPDLFKKENAPKVSLSRIATYKKDNPTAKVDPFFENQHKTAPQTQQTSPAKPTVASSAKNSTNTSSVSDVIYTIKPGDTLSEIAKKNKINIAELQKANNIKNPNKISAGAKLKIPMKKKSSADSWKDALKDFKIKKSDDLDKLFKNVYEENPKFWPSGLSKSNYNGANDVLKNITDDKGNVIGFVGVQPRVGKRYLSVALKKEYRGKGLGYSSVKALLDEKGLGKKDTPVYWTVHQDNAPSKALLEKLQKDGYNIILNEKHAVVDPISIAFYASLATLAGSAWANISRDSSVVGSLSNMTVSQFKNLSPDRKDGVMQQFKNLEDQDELKNWYMKHLRRGGSTLSSNNSRINSMYRNIEQDYRTVSRAEKANKAWKESGVFGKAWQGVKNIANSWVVNPIEDTIKKGIPDAWDAMLGRQVVNATTGEYKSRGRALLDAVGGASEAALTFAGTGSLVKGGLKSIGKNTINIIKKHPILTAAGTAGAVLSAPPTSLEDLPYESDFDFNNNQL